MSQTETEMQGPAGFRQVEGREPTGPRVEKDVLKGVILEFCGTRRFARRKGTGETVVHVFLARGGKGKRFSVFGTADLDDKLRAVKSGSIIWLQYAGKRETDGQEKHIWQVSDAGKRLDDTQLNKLLANSEKQHVELDAAIETATTANAARFRSGEGAPDWDREFSDDEIPF